MYVFVLREQVKLKNFKKVTTAWSTKYYNLSRKRAGTRSVQHCLRGVGFDVKIVYTIFTSIRALCKSNWTLFQDSFETVEFKLELYQIEKPFRQVKPQLQIE